MFLYVLVILIITPVLPMKKKKKEQVTLKHWSQEPMPKLGIYFLPQAALL